MARRAGRWAGALLILGAGCQFDSSGPAPPPSPGSSADASPDAIATTGADAADPALACASGAPFFDDDFEDGTVDDAAWNRLEAGASEEAGELVLRSDLASPSGVRSAELYDFTGATVTVELSGPPVSGMTGAAGLRFKRSAEQNFVAFEVERGELEAYIWRPDDDGEEVAEVPFDPTEHRFLRLREEGGTLYWEFSSDATSWSELGNTSTPPVAENVNLQLSISDADEASMTTESRFEYVIACR